MRDIFLLSLYFSFIFLGTKAPYFFVLGYVWVDIFMPQHVAWGFFGSIPVSMIMGGVTFLVFLLMRKPDGILLTRETSLIVFFVFWMTVSLAWSEVPPYAYEKWNWAFKSVLFSCLLPVFIRDKIQVDSLIWIVVLSAMAHCIPYGIKVILSGGGYRANYSLIEGNSGFAEGSTLSLLAITIIPLCIYLLKNDSIFEKSRLVTIFLVGCILASLVASLGTFARTGLVSLVTLAISFALLLKRRIFYITILSIAASILLAVMGEQWENRMSTINDSNEESAMGRIAVWKWTWNYVLNHPLGGGFDAYRINYIELPLDNGRILVAASKAFHSIYFEILGELGFVGIGTFFLIIIFALISCIKIKKSNLNLSNQWIKHLSEMLLASLMVYLVGGAFIGIAYQSLFWYLIGIIASISIIHKSQKAVNC